MKKDFQIPLAQPAPKNIQITIDQVVPSYRFDAPPLTDDLVQSIAEKWILQSIVVCPDPETGLYYPLAGRRRVMAIRYLETIEGFKYHGKPVNKLKIPAMLREDLKPGDVYSDEIAFEENHIRSDNLLTDVQAVIAMADNLKVDLSDSEGQKAIAKRLKTPVGTIKKIIAYITLPEAAKQALAEGRVTEAGLKILTKLPTKQQAPILEALESGEFVSTEKIKTQQHKAVVKALQKIGQPTIIDMDFAESPVQDAYDILVSMLEEKDFLLIDEVKTNLQKVKELLEQAL